MQPGVVAYDPLHPPAGSIQSVHQYPGLSAVHSRATARRRKHRASGDPVGLQSIGNIYLSVPGETYPNGAEFTDTRGTFEKHLVVTPFGANAYWEKIA